MQPHQTWCTVTLSNLLKLFCIHSHHPCDLKWPCSYRAQLSRQKINSQQPQGKELPALRAALAWGHSSRRGQPMDATSTAPGLIKQHTPWLRAPSHNHQTHTQQHALQTNLSLRAQATPDASTNPTMVTHTSQQKEQQRLQDCRASASRVLRPAAAAEPPSPPPHAAAAST